MIFLINVADPTSIREKGFPTGILLGGIARDAWQGPTGLDDVWLQVDVPKERFDAIIEVLREFTAKNRLLLRTRVYKRTPTSLRKIESRVEIP